MYCRAMNRAIMKPPGKAEKFVFARMKHARQKNRPQIKYLFPKLGYINLRTLPRSNLRVQLSHCKKCSIASRQCVRPRATKLCQTHPKHPTSLPSLHVFLLGVGHPSMQVQLLPLTRLFQSVAPGCSSAVHKTKQGAALCQSLLRPSSFCFAHVHH